MNRPATKRLTLEQLESRILLAADVYRSFTGEGNNDANPSWGAADVELLRITTPSYGDGVSTPAGGDRPSARLVSNVVADQSGDIFNQRQLTDFVWAWGQFIDHDIDLSEGADPAEPFPIPVPTGDPFFDPDATGDQVIPLNRTVYEEGVSPRQQLNEITAFIDASNVYGSDSERSAALREFVGGKLQTSPGDLLIYNTAGLPNAMGTSPEFFLAGDVRANENVLLTSLHTLFVREHNRLAGELAAGEFAGQDLSDPQVDEQIYQQARQLVGAQLQAITFNEFLPALLGYGSVDAYSGYDPSVNPGIANVFSTAAYRVGHTMLSPNLARLDAGGSTIPAGDLPLRDGFFAPQEIEDNGIDPLLQGAAAQLMQRVDIHVIDDVRNFLFGPPGAGGFDLASLNMQRGRDHGLPSYTQVRLDMGLSPVTEFSQISSDPAVVARLMAAYDNVDKVDAWIGGLAEDPLEGSSLGELVYKIVGEQFERLRVGDRFWYENTLDPALVEQVGNTQLSDILRRNTLVDNIQDNVFLSDSVLYYRAPTQAAAQQLSLSLAGGFVRISDAGGVVASSALADTTAVVLEGPAAASGAVEIVVKAGDLAGLAALPITINGAQRASLTIEGGSADDVVDVSDRQATVNGVTIAATDLLQIQMLGKAGADTLRGDVAMQTPLAVDAGSGDDIVVGGAAADTLQGGAGKDAIYAGGGDDLIYGSLGDDNLNGELGDDVIYGGDGDDSLNGGGGNDILLGQIGDDSIAGGSGNDAIYAGPGADFAEGDSGEDFIRGDDGDDLIMGGSSNDTLWGDAGRDVVHGQGGDDFVDGGPGNDMLYGQIGADLLHGGDDDDVIYGNSGDDEMMGDAGNDILLAQNGDDKLFGGDGQDALYAGAGNDLADGGAGSDYIRGDTGDDQLSGGADDDMLSGGPGADMLHGDAGADWLHGEADEDQLWGDSGDDFLMGGDAADVVRGGSGNDVLEGNDGPDNLQGEGGDDLIRGGADNDLIYGQSGSDVIYAGSGDDLVYGNSGHDEVFGEAGRDVLLGQDGDDSLHGGLDDDVIYLGTGFGYAEGNEGDDMLRALDGNQVLRGNEGKDLLFGGDGEDLLDGGPGDDQLYGEAGRDLLFGGDGVDWLDGGSEDDLLLGGEGHDTALGRAGDDLYAGNAGDDVLIDSPGDDAMFAGPGYDRLDSGDQNDLLVSDNPGDVLLPGAGLDILVRGGAYLPSSEAVLSQQRLDSLLDLRGLWTRNWYVQLSLEIQDALPDLGELKLLIP